MTDTTEDVRPNGSFPEPSAAEHITNETTLIEGSSDGEGEKSARERLKKTSIAGLAQKTETTANETEDRPQSQSTIMENIDTGNTNDRGRPAKKRSFEDLNRGEPGISAGGESEEQPNPKSGHHKRMRSRDVASGEHAIGKYDGSAASPVYEESDPDAQKAPGGPGVLVDVSNIPTDREVSDAAELRAASQENGQPAGTMKEDLDLSTKTAEPKGDTQTITGTSEFNASPGFANASATSPFGTATASNTSTKVEPVSESNKTSASAFAASGLSAFAASEKSPFGAALKSPGGFGDSSKSSFASSSGGFSSGPPSVFGAKSAGVGFGGSSGGFGSSSGFGNAGGFGVPKPFGNTLSSFAGASGTAGSFGTGKPFGSSKEKADEDEGIEDDDDDDESGITQEDEDQDDRFVAQDVKTGEEAEETIFQHRAKLFHFDREWKERGVGVVKINVTHSRVEGEAGDSDEAGEDLESGRGRRKMPRVERRGRLLMRTEAVHRLILNTPIFQAMKIGQSDGSPPVGKTMHLTGLEDGKPVLFQIKIAKEEVIKEMYRKILDLRAEAKS